MSSSHYIPPHMRNRRGPNETLKKKEEVIKESDFPEFVADIKPVKPNTGPSYVSKASAAPTEPLIAPHKNPELKFEKNRVRKSVIHISEESFNKSPVESTKPSVDEDGFQTVDYRKKKNNSLSNKIDKALRTTGELSSEDDENERDTLWNTTEEEDTYWTRF